MQENLNLPENPNEYVERMLKPQDVVLALKLVCKDGCSWSQASLAAELAMSASEVNAGLKRLALATLVEPHADGRRCSIIRPALREFLIHGLKYVFPAEKGAPAIGMPTANAGYPLKEFSDPEQTLPVWPVKDGKVKGFSLKPLYPTVAKAAQNDSELYAYLVLVDALRDTQNEQADIAQVMLRDRLSKPKKRLQSPQTSTALGGQDGQLDLLAL